MFGFFKFVVSFIFGHLSLTISFSAVSVRRAASSTKAWSRQRVSVIITDCKSE